MELTTVEEGGVTAVEGPPGAPLMARADDVDLVIEACFSTGARAAVLHAENLPSGFFDLSSGQAGAILQKLRMYGVRLAVVAGPGEVSPSSRFGEMVAEESRGPHFGLFETREAAWEWLAQS